MKKRKESEHLPVIGTIFESLHADEARKLPHATVGSGAVERKPTYQQEEM